ncbi:MAG TPA: hypothetical protein VKM93_10415 [Terriglobia bacterium]|nr:hypothetical protein [Terriglobia bacterium]
MEAEEPGLEVRDSGFAEADGSVASAAPEGGVAPPFCESRAPNPESPSSSSNPESRIPNPGSSANPVSSPKPKRKYTVSEKSRAASLRNLALANQAPHWLKYRLSERRVAHCYKALEKAVAEMRRFDSPHYGVGFKRGTYCASLTRSLALAGETKEEYETHLERMRQAFAPLSERERKLVLAAAQAVWRRLRVYGGQGRWELYAVASILGELIAEREAEAERRAAAERAGETVEPLDPYHDPFGDFRAVAFGIDLIRLLQEDGLEKEAGYLNRRIQMLLEALGQEPNSEDDAAKSAEMDAETFAAVNGNPLRGEAQAAATLNQDRQPLKDPSHWRNAPGAGESAGENAGNGSEGNEAKKEKKEKKSDPHPCERAADLAHRGGLMRLLRRQGVNNPEFSRLEGPDGKAVWIDLWQRAFGIDPARREQSSILEMAEITWERIQMHLQHREKEAANVKEVLEEAILAKKGAVEGIDDCKTGTTSSSPTASAPDTDPKGGPAPRHNQEPFCNRQSSIDPARRGQLLVALLGALGVYKCMGAVLEAGKDMKAAYHRMLVAFYGDLPSFDFFKPKAPTLSELVDDLGSFVAECISLKDGPIHQDRQQQIKWRGGSGRQPGGGP